MPLSIDRSKFSNLNGGHLTQAIFQLAMALNEGKIRTYTHRNGVQFVTNISEKNTRVLMALGVFEAEKMELLKQIARPGDSFLDVGAHHGFFGLTAAKLLGPSGVVILVEPHPFNIAILKRSIELNGFTNLDLQSCAASDRDGTLLLYQANFTGEHTIVEGELERVQESKKWRTDPIASDKPPLEVATKQIDTIVGEMTVSGRLLLKVDVQGAELDVAKGMQETLNNHRPIIFMDCDQNTPDFYTYLNSVFSDQNYQFFDELAVNKVQGFSLEFRKMLLVPGEEHVQIS